MIERIAILGTGLLGTSAGLALRAAGFRGTISGWNRSSEQAQIALSMSAMDSIATDPAQAALDAALELLRDGRFLGFFPEGTRSPDGRLYRGRSGIGYLVLRSGAPVIPVAMN